MHEKEHKFQFTQSSKNALIFEYLGTNNLPIIESYKIYLQKSAQFIAKAKKFKQNNLNIKNSLLHQNRYGYTNSEDFEEEVLAERKAQMEHFKKMYNVTAFDDDVECMFENFTGKSKRIRLIREKRRPKIQKFSQNFEKETKFWFTRYCILSKFIQAARLVIIINRLNAVLRKLKSLNPLAIEELIKRRETVYNYSDNIKEIFRSSSFNESFKEHHCKTITKNYISPCNI